MALLAGCAGHRRKEVKNIPPPPPPVSTPEPGATPRPVPSPTPGARPTPRPAPTPVPHISDEITVPENAKVLYKEVGWASWYGPGFQNRKAANGETFDTERMTAAHRTLPLNSIVRVTNLKTGESALVRITDRGPFVGDRILDLSRAAARKLSVIQRGTALVRIEVLESPVPLDSGGRWCVQIGAFAHRTEAAKLKEKLVRRYHTARILQFSSPMGGDWLRILVANDDKKRAESLIHETHTDAAMFLVRLD
ncbi:MAG TPA: septal ring lytic transglycosylase RlpA family protein [Candidatus Limnocylindrales bacterium]|nr:septal ring lytic transglycosylase RlpA family protein [Candidatus Limnocylindrales bacterium]